ncbi:phage integrase [Lentisphaera araneosa HTCC2155]|uniref:Phage integrase n=1 Tax=Lentisphaera araneosa HTCC2155 TaxID=313628 RepID=A6DT72_9BACT|nr:tyrosine-type recombinase/integrase [Lentisphaera araneosa]EDM25145.1 phage integrase [Lentisphaera araneosa HTCC2155]
MKSKFDHFYNLMKSALFLQGKAHRTRDSYLRALRRINKMLTLELDEITEEDLKKYFLKLLRTYAVPTVKSDRCGLAFFYKYVLSREFNWGKIIRIQTVHKLPSVLTQKEIAHVLSYVKRWRHRVCLTAIYSMGLRVSEALKMRPSDICVERKILHIRNSKGCRDRLVPLPDLSLQMINDFWLSHRSPNYIFPQIRDKSNMVNIDKHMYIGAVQGAFRMAVLESGIMKRVSVHNLRHSYATHMMEKGVPIMAIQEILGHRDIKTTMIYARLTELIYENRHDQIRKLMSPLEFLNNSSNESLHISSYSLEEINSLCLQKLSINNENSHKM